MILGETILGKARLACMSVCLFVFMATTTPYDRSHCFLPGAQRVSYLKKWMHEAPDLVLCCGIGIVSESFFFSFVELFEGCGHSVHVA